MTDEPQRLLLLGATSDMGIAIARAFAARGHAVALAARDPQRLERDVADLSIRYGVPVTACAFDVLDTDGHAAFLDGLPWLPDVAICVVGLLGKQAQAETDSDHASLIMRSNYEGPALILGALANRFQARGRGTLIGVSSVAGDRGRASNYVYGSAKAGFTAFLSGLRNRLARHGVHVITVKPGFVRTRMIEGMRTPALLTASPAEVGDAVYQAWRRGRDQIYVRPVWRLVMAIIRAIPERLFKRLSL